MPPAVYLLDPVGTSFKIRPRAAASRVRLFLPPVDKVLLDYEGTKIEVALSHAEREVVK
jgi:hypothetical protein